MAWMSHATANAPTSSKADTIQTGAKEKIALGSFSFD
jgi:hypothetical protein